MRRLVAVIGCAAALATAAACSGGGSDQGRCATWKRLSAADAALAVPAAFDLTAGEVEDQLAARDGLYDRLAEAPADDAETARLDRLRGLSRIVGPQWVLAWDDRATLAKAGRRWPQRVFPAGGDAAAWTEVDHLAKVEAAALYAECDRPSAAKVPTADRSLDPPDEQIVFHRADELWSMASTGKGAAKVPLPAGVRRGRDPVAGVDGAAVAAVVTDADGLDALVVGPAGGPFEVAYRSPDRALSCPSFADEPERILVTAETPDGRVRVFGVDRTGDAVDVVVDLADFTCVTQLADRSLLASGATDDLDEPGGVVLLTPEGGRPERVFGVEGCTSMLGDRSPDGSTLAVAVSCDAPGQDGLYLVDASTRRGRRLVAGWVETPRFSVDGSWLAYRFAPYGSDPDLDGTIWLSTTAGKGRRPLLDGPAETPTWVVAPTADDATTSTTSTSTSTTTTGGEPVSPEAVAVAFVRAAVSGGDPAPYADAPEIAEAAVEQLRAELVDAEFSIDPDYEHPDSQGDPAGACQLTGDITTTCAVRVSSAASDASYLVLVDVQRGANGKAPARYLAVRFTTDVPGGD